MTARCAWRAFPRAPRRRRRDLPTTGRTCPARHAPLPRTAPRRVPRASCRYSDGGNPPPHG